MFRHASQNGSPTPIVGVVMQDDEIADVVVFRGGGAVEFAAPLLDVAEMREMQDQPLDRDLDQVDGRGLERLEEPAREPHAHHVAVPELLAPPGRELDQPRLRERRRIEVREQQLARAFIAS